MKKEQLKIKNRNGVMLSATIDLPIGPNPIAYAIFAHCFTCTSNLGAVRNIASALTLNGFGVVRFDFTGLGKSEGEFADSHFTANINDLEDVNTFISKYYTPPVLIIGHSLGGAAAIVAASKLDNIKAVATIGAPSCAEHVKQHFGEQSPQATSQENIEVSIGGRPFQINKDFIDQFSKVNVQAVLQKLKKPILIMHAPFDKIVGIENAQEIFEQAHHPKSFVSLDRADHLLSDANDSQYAGNVIAAWAKRYFPKTVEEKPNIEGEQLYGHLDLKQDNFTTTLRTEHHTFIADEPKSMGGNDNGPAPYDFLNAGLAACTVMTMKLYAERKKWDLQEAFVYISHKKMKDQKGDPYDTFIKKIKLLGELDEKQKLRLKEIAAKCLVQKTLTTRTTTETELIN